MTAPGLSGPSNQLAMNKSKKRRLQRLSQAQKKKISKLEGIQIKELPSNEIGCLITVKEGQVSEDKLK